MKAIIDYRSFVESSGEFNFIELYKNKSGSPTKIVFSDSMGYRYCMFKVSIENYFKDRKELTIINRRGLFNNHNAKILVEQSGEFQFLDFEYRNKSPFIHFINRDGYKYSIQTTSIKSYFEGSQLGFSPFHKSNPYTIENIKLWMKNNNYKHLLISENYVNSDEKLTLECREHGEFYANWNAIQYHSNGCSKCMKNDSSYAKDLFFEELKSRGDMLLSDYTSATNKVLIQFTCGHKPRWIAPNSYRSGNGCLVCSNLCPIKAKENFVALVEENGDNLLSEYIDSETKVLIEFNRNKCTHESHLIKPYNYKLGKACPKCAIESRSGENSIWWNPNLTDEERFQTRKYEEYKLWVKSVFIRDNYTCLKCGKRGNGELNAHHIYNFSEHEEKRIDIDNGVTLCKDCHQSFHKRYGWRNNNDIQLDMYLQEA